MLVYVYNIIYSILTSHDMEKTCLPEQLTYEGREAIAKSEEYFEEILYPHYVCTEGGSKKAHVGWACFLSWSGRRERSGLRRFSVGG